MSGDSYEAHTSISLRLFSCCFASRAITKLLSLRVALVAALFASLVSPTMHATCNFDIDGNGRPEALTDGLLLIRSMLGLTGDALTQGALGVGATRTLTADLQTFIASQDYNLDGNTVQDVSTDGLLALRYLFGFRGDALTAGVIGAGASRNSDAAIINHIKGGCATQIATASAAPGVVLASANVLNNLVEIKVQHGGAGQVVINTDVRADPSVALGNTVLFQPIDNPLSTIAVKIDTTLFENGHTILGVRTAKLDEVFSSLNVNMSAALDEGQLTTKRAIAGVTFKLEDAQGNQIDVPSQDQRAAHDAAKAGVWFPPGGFNIDTRVIRTSAPPGSIGFSKLIIEAKDAVLWDSDGNLSTTDPVSAPQLLLNGTIGFEDARFDTIIDWPNTAQPPNRLGAKASGTWLSSVSLKLTGGSLSYGLSDFAGVGASVAKNNELDLGVAKIKGVKWDDGRVNIGTVAWNIPTQAVVVGGFNQTVAIPLGVLITFYLGLDGKITAAAEVGVSYSSYIEKGGVFDFNRQTFTPYNVLASGAFPNPNKPGNPSPTPADYASKPSPTFTAKVTGAVTASAVAGIEVGVVVMGIVPLVVDNKIKEDINVTASLGTASANGWFGCVAGTSSLTLDSKFRVNAEITGSKAFSWLGLGGSIGYSFEKTLGSWSPVPFDFGGSAGNCAAEITADYAYAFTGSGLTGGLLTSLAATASTATGIITKYAWKINDRPTVPATGQNITVDLSPGLHDVLLTVTDSAARTRDIRKSIRVLSLTGPVASLGWYPKDVKAGDVVTFDGSASQGSKTPTATSPINLYRWNFGDGTAVITTASAAPLTHTYALGGSYDVNLTVTADSGLTSDITRRLWVGTQPVFSGSVATQRINDTGITFSGEYPTGNNAGCTGSNNLAAQDCINGRDANLPAKVGGGTAGFDFTKISNSGGVLPASAVLGSGSNDWACTRDNVTGLIWEVKTVGGLRDKNHSYSWLSSDFTNNGGTIGTINGGVCSTAGRCDTEKFVQDVNTAGLCGLKDWRIPNLHELESIVNYGSLNPAIDYVFFPNTPIPPGSKFWSSAPTRGGGAWYVDFWLPATTGALSTSANRVRVVHGRK